MDAELMKDYEDVAEMLEKCYGANKEYCMSKLCEHGHEKVFKNPALLGLNEEQSKSFKSFCDFLNSFYGMGGEVEYVERDDF